MQIVIKDLIKTLDLRLDYIFKLLRESRIKNRIILDKEDLINLLHYLKCNCTTQKRYKLYIYLNSFLKNEGLQNV